jgi:hypothetical protein
LRKKYAGVRSGVGRLHTREKEAIVRGKKRRVGLTMAEQGRKPVYVRVRDGAGNQFLCPIDALKDITNATQQELENCVDNAVAERYAGEIKVVGK